MLELTFVNQEPVTRKMLELHYLILPDTEKNLAQIEQEFEAEHKVKVISMELLAERTVPIRLIDFETSRAHAESGIEALCADLRQNGQQVPVRLKQQAGRFVIFDGARRIVALLLLGQGEVKALVYG